MNEEQPEKKMEAREETKRNLPERTPMELDWASLKDNSFNQIGNTLKFNPYLFTQALSQQELFLTFRDNETLYKYEKSQGIWHNGADTHIKEVAGVILKTDITTHTLNECLTSIKVQTYIDREKTEEKQKGLIPLKNGVYNLNTKEIQPYQPNFYFTTQLPVEYNPSATCPKIDAFLSEIVDLTDLPLLYEIFAFCLMEGYEIQTAILLIGAGSNGKGVYLRLLTKFLGKDNVSNVPLQTLGGDKNRFAGASLHKKYANICADLPNQALKNTGNFKMLTGGDTVYAEGKFKDSFGFVNRAKLIFSANEAPPLYEDTDAIYRRWILIVFPNQFLGVKDKKSLFAEVTTEEELSGLLNKVLPLIQKLQETGFSQPKTIEETRSHYKRLSSSTFSFSERVVELLDGWIETEKIFNAYLTHCTAIRSIARPRDAFFKELRGFCPFIYPSKRRVEGALVPGYIGLKLDENNNMPLETIGDRKQPTLNTFVPTVPPKISSNIEENTVIESTKRAEQRNSRNTFTENIPIRTYQLPHAILHLLTKEGSRTQDQLYASLRATFPALETLQIAEFEHVVAKMREKGEIYEISGGVLAKT